MQEGKTLTLSMNILTWEFIPKFLNFRLRVRVVLVRALFLEYRTQ